MKTLGLLLLLFAVAVVCSTGAINLPPNRGTQLILLMEAGGAAWQITAIDAPSKWVIQTWDRYNPTYDFIFAVTSRSGTGCKVNFFRYVMSTDYVPREEHFEAEFPYSQQARYRFFDRGNVIGFYRISFYDFDHRLIFPQPSNQSMKPTRPLQENLSEFATTSSRGLSPSR